MRFLYLLTVFQLASSFVMNTMIDRSTFIKGFASSSVLLCTASSAEVYSEVSPVERTGIHVSFAGPVTQETCALLRRAINDAINESQAIQNAYALDKAPPVKLSVQSPGGELLPSFGIVDMITSSVVPIHSTINGYAASAASLICVACHERSARANSIVLIHQLSGSAEGKLDDVKRQVDNMNVFMRNVKNIYLQHTNITLKDLDRLLVSDEWLDANECLRLGIVDKILN